MTNWRLKKHKKMHSNPRLKQCFYFQNDIQCPFDELGCKFAHGFEPQADDLSDECMENVDDNQARAKLGGSDTFNHEVQSARKKASRVRHSILTTSVFVDSLFFTSTPKKSYKNHNCSKNNYMSCDDCLDEVIEGMDREENDDLATGQAALLLGT